MDRLFRASRIFRTGLAFGTFGLGACVLTLLIVPIVRWRSRSRADTDLRVQVVVHRSFGAFVRWMERLKLIVVEFEGEQPGGSEPVVVVANHPTLIDFVLIASVVPRCECIVKESLWSNRFLGGSVRAIGYIRNSEGPLLLKLCRESLGEDGVLVVFPEGTRRKSAQPLKLTRGAAQIAVRNHYDLRLVHVSCDPPTLAKGEKWYHIPPRRPLFTVRVGERICVNSYIDSSPSASVAARRLTADLSTALFPSAIQPLRKAGHS